MRRPIAHFRYCLVPLGHCDANIRAHCTPPCARHGIDRRCCKRCMSRPMSLPVEFSRCTFCFCVLPVSSPGGPLICILFGKKFVFGGSGWLQPCPEALDLTGVSSAAVAGAVGRAARERRRGRGLPPACRYRCCCCCAAVALGVRHVFIVVLSIYSIRTGVAHVYSLLR